MSNLVSPHGSNTLKPLLLTDKALVAELEIANSLPKINLSSREVDDVIMLDIGGFTPLNGFMNQDDWQSVCDNMTIEGGLF